MNKMTDFSELDKRLDENFSYLDLFTKLNLKSFLHHEIQQVEKKTWKEAWLRGVESGMRFFDITGVCATKLPGTDITIKQKIDQLVAAEEPHE